MSACRVIEMPASGQLYLLRYAVHYIVLKEVKALCRFKFQDHSCWKGLFPTCTIWILKKETAIIKMLLSSFVFSLTCLCYYVFHVKVVCKERTIWWILSRSSSLLCFDTSPVGLLVPLSPHQKMVFRHVIRWWASSRKEKPEKNAPRWKQWLIKLPNLTNHKLVPNLCECKSTVHSAVRCNSVW